MNGNILVEFTERKHNFDYSGQWADEIVEGAQDPKDAINILMDCMIDWGANPTAYIYRVRDYNEIVSTCIPEYDNFYDMEGGED